MARKSSPAAVEPSSPVPAAPPPAPAPVTPTDIATPTGSSPVAEPSSVSPDTFAWDQWDGSYDPFPEPVRPWLEKAEGRHKSKYEQLNSEAEYVKKLYGDLTSDMGDPRVKELESKYSEAEQRLLGLTEREQELTSALAAMTKERDDERRAAVEEEANRYRQANQWIFDGGEKQQAASSLFEEGFELGIIPDLLKATPQVRESARKHHKELLEAGARNVGAKALMLAKAEFQAAAPSSPAATMISGANGTPSAGTTTPARPPTDASLRDSYGEAIRLAKLQLGRK